MKIPHINKIIQTNFDRYIKDLEQSTNTSIVNQKSRVNNRDLFETVYPLFVLMETLFSSIKLEDPTKAILLNEYQLKKDKVRFLNVLRKNTYYGVDEDNLHIGIRKTVFTPYFDELYSDLLILCNNFYFNNYRACYISLRCILEDLYRHIYYKDHVQEFLAISENYDEFSFKINPQFFRDYLKKTSYLKLLNGINITFAGSASDINNDIFKWNEDLYSKTSSFVHASKHQYMNQFKKNSDLLYNDKSSNETISIASEITQITIILLTCAHINYFIQIHDFEKSIILSTFDKDIKHNFRQLLNI